MIFTERNITIRNDSATINAPVILYRGDKNVEVRFILIESPYKYSNRDSINIFESTDASYAQLVIKTPNDREPIFGDITAVGNNNVTFVIRHDMIDEIEEVGKYDFQIRLFDADQTSMATTPEVVGGFIIKEPIAKEDSNNNITNSAIVGSAVVTNDLEIPTFVGSSYNKTEWHDGDVISKQKLNKMENGIYETYELSKDNSSKIKEKANKNEIFSMANMGQDIKEAITGGSVAVVGENSVLNINLVDRQITPSKTTFAKHENLFNIYECIIGKSASATVGTSNINDLGINNKMGVTRTYNVNENDKFSWKFTDGILIIFYDENDLVASTGGNWQKSGSITIPAGIKKFRINFLLTDNYSDNTLVKGSTVPNQYISSDRVSIDLVEVDELREKIKDNQLSSNHYVSFINCERFSGNSNVTINNKSINSIEFTKIQTSNAQGIKLNNDIDLSVCNFEKFNIKFNYSSSDTFGVYFGDNFITNLSGTGSFNKEVTREYLETNSLLNNFNIQLTSANALTVSITEFYITGSLKGGNLLEVLENINKNNQDKIINYLQMFNRICCIGDSLTEGVIENIESGVTKYRTYTKYSYPYQLGRMLNTTVINQGKGGATAIDNDAEQSWNKVATQKNWFNPADKCECYIIQIGTNDIGYYNSFTGNVEIDIDYSDYNNNAVTSVGGYAKIIQRVKEIQPKAKIFCIALSNDRNETATRTEANTKIRAITTKFENCYFIDLQNMGVSETNITSWKDKYYLGGHMNALGYKYRAEELVKFINKYINDNLSDFKNIQFIGYNYEYN